MTKPYNEATALLIDAEVKRIAEECVEHACQLLSENRIQLDTLAQALLRENFLNEQEILDVTGIRSRIPHDNGNPD